VFAGISNAAEAIELIADRDFQRGFILWKPEPGRHVRYGELPDADAKPVWGLAQWNSRFALKPHPVSTNADGSLTWSNAAKSIRFGATAEGSRVLVLAADSGIEYDDRSRRKEEPWVHLLVEQKFESALSLTELAAAKFRVEARLIRSRNSRPDDYSPDRHAAQFLIFFTVRNDNRKSSGHGDILWFGVPVYDNREPFPKEHKALDRGTGKFIFTPNGRAYTSTSAHDGEWIVLERDLLPLMRDALETAWKRGFLQGSKEMADYRIGGMNMGWELPGSFDVEMQIRGLTLKLIPGTDH
jgi:hypothetical protein